MTTATKSRTKKKKKNIIPVGDNVLLELIISEETEGGIVLPKAETNTAKVLAIGCGVDKNLIADAEDGLSRGFSIGDTVYLPKGDTLGTVVNSEDGTKRYLVLPPKYIAFIIEKK